MHVLLVFLDGNCCTVRFLFRDGGPMLNVPLNYSYTIEGLFEFLLMVRSWKAHNNLLNLGPFVQCMLFSEGEINAVMSNA